MTPKTFNELTNDWPVSKSFRSKVLNAINRHESEVELSTSEVTKVDARWLTEHGFVAQIEKGKVTIEL